MSDLSGQVKELIMVKVVPVAVEIGEIQSPAAYYKRDEAIARLNSRLAEEVERIVEMMQRHVTQSGTAAASHVSVAPAEVTTEEVRRISEMVDQLPRHELRMVTHGDLMDTDHP